ncbi:MAG: UvrD-helicase domain-containing protein, partial [Hyphomicrobiaceae bacterium]|nr:UvrD-helicase domain-containing protein [Hyphomicrobiaceae bacterium]
MPPLSASATSAREDTRRNQAAAADPTASAWVSANAGTGKTHVLTLRMLRLLLSGTEPARILALTYTKAAAAEMATRVFARLAEWVTASNETLTKALRELLERNPTTDEMRRARQLFALVIETPGGLKVETVHAFCERLLQRFPLEAGVPPGFEILDGDTQDALLAEATDQVLTEAAKGNADTPLADALKRTIAYAAESNFDALLADALRHRTWLGAQHVPAPEAHADTLRYRAWLGERVRLDPASDGLRPEEVEALYRRALGLAPHASLARTDEALAGLLTKAELLGLRDILANGSRADMTAAERVDAVLAATTEAGRVAALGRLFLTDGEPRKTLMTRGLAAQYPDAADQLQQAQSRFAALHEERSRLQLMEATLGLVRLASAVMQRYTDAKMRHAELDFDDLLAKAASLLRNSPNVEWVLYKLDGGLDHILLDEAQDTSPVQWRVITALAEEFFAGIGAYDKARTLFAVGDEKQSIYSFQGAEPGMFATQGAALGKRAELAGASWRRVPLTLSFRSVEPLLAAVDAIFADPRRTPGLGTAPVRHAADRTGHAGLIEVWPTEKHEAADPAEPWSPLEETANTTPSVVRLANRIADTIAGWLKSGERLVSEDRPVRAGDILVLVRKRAPFAPALVTALKARAVPVAGADRLMLTEQIAVEDLMALGDALMLPDDDLALAAVLKSPLFGLDDENLMRLAHGRSQSLWAQLQAEAGAGGQLAEA